MISQTCNTDSFRRLLAMVGLFALLVVGGCGPWVAKPSSDSTPPSLSWSVLNKSTNEQKVISGSGTIHFGLGSQYFVVLHAKDPQGVYSTSLGSSVGWTCVGNGVSQGSGPSLAVLNTQISQPNSDGKVPTEAVNATNGSMGPFDCQAGYTLSGATLTFFGEGQNYFNGVTKGQLVLVFP
jgi:hypothetical protein